MNPADVGFQPGVKGHTLKYDSTSNYGNTHIFKCQCGLQVHSYGLTQKGTVTGHAKRHWKNHLDALGVQDEIFSAGAIQKVRVRWEVFVFTRAYSGAVDFADGGGSGYRQQYYKEWPTASPSDWQYNCCWAVGVSKSTGKKHIDGLYTNKTAALERARKILLAAENKGDTVYWGSDAHVEAPIVSPKLTLMEFMDVVDDALISNKVQVVRNTLTKLDEFLTALPVLQARGEQLRTHYHQLLTMGLDIGIEQTQEENDPEASAGA